MTQAQMIQKNLSRYLANAAKKAIEREILNTARYVGETNDARAERELREVCGMYAALMNDPSATVIAILKSQDEK